jgi:hypothetical protein
MLLLGRQAFRLPPADATMLIRHQETDDCQLFVRVAAYAHVR